MEQIFMLVFMVILIGIVIYFGIKENKETTKENTFTALLQKCEVKQSFSATARPHDNAVAETFFASFKKEEAYRREYTSEQSYRKSVEQYIRFYNELRPHRTLKYKTPQAFEEAYRERL